MSWLTFRLHRTEVFLLGLMLLLFYVLFLSTHGEAVRITSALAGGACEGGNFAFSQECLPTPSRVVPNRGAGATLAQPCSDRGRPHIGPADALRHRTRHLPHALDARCYPAALVGDSGRVCAFDRNPVRHRFQPADEVVNSPWNALEGRMSQENFDLRGVLQIGYVIFAIGLVLALGTFIKRLGPTIIIASIVYVGVRIPFLNVIRPKLLPMSVREVDLEQRSVTRDWVVSAFWQTKDGTRLSEDALFQLCNGGESARKMGQGCYRRIVSPNMD